MNDDPTRRNGDEPFAGCSARLDRAAEHREAFGTEWARFLEPHPYRVYVEVQADGRGVVGIRRHEAMPAQLSLLIGEFLYELRSALDNCLFEVAVLHSGKYPPPGAGVLQFPIYDDREAWERNLYRLKHLSDEHRTMLERIQPFNAQRQDLNCLSILNRLARSDRHRTLHLVGAFLVQGGLLIEAPKGSRLTEMRKTGQLVVDSEAEIATFTVVPWTPGQVVDHLPDLTLEVEISEMATDRPWGPLDRRLHAVHRAVSDYIEVLAAYALGMTEPDPDA